MHLSAAAATTSIPIMHAPSKRDQQILDARAEGMTLAAIASLTGATVDVVTRSLSRMRAAGITIPEPGGNDRIWSASRIEVLRQRAAEGWSARRVAEEIGLSRNAVLGKANRLGVVFDPERGRSNPPGESVVWWTQKRIETLRRLAAAGSPSPTIANELGTSAQKVRDKARVLGISLKMPPPRLSPLPAILQAAAEIAEVTASATGEATQSKGKGIGSATSLSAAPADAITIHDLRDGRCHWPFGDPRDEGFRYCGAAVDRATRDRGLSYCAGHMAVAYAPGKRRGR